MQIFKFLPIKSSLTCNMHCKNQMVAISSLDYSIWHSFCLFSCSPPCSDHIKLSLWRHNLLKRKMKEKKQLWLHFLLNTLCPRLQHTHFSKEDVINRKPDLSLTWLIIRKQAKRMPESRLLNWMAIFFLTKNSFGWGVGEGWTANLCHTWPCCDTFCDTFDLTVLNSWESEL